jgi:multisubunit Na+/H+ antiporter MnhF subunit
MAHGRSIRHPALRTSTAKERCVMNQTHSDIVLAQRYTYATIALVVGLLSFVNFFGFEKSILAVVLGLKALSQEPAPALDARRSWAKSAVALGTAQVALVVTIILLNLDRIPKLIEAFRALSDGA